MDVMKRLRDKIDGLESELKEAVRVAYNRGATEWARANYPSWVKEWGREAAWNADCLREARAENARLREALKPFSDYAAYLDTEWPDHPNDIIVAGPLNGNMTFGDFRTARAVLGDA